MKNLAYDFCKINFTRKSNGQYDTAIYANHKFFTFREMKDLMDKYVNISNISCDIEEYNFITYCAMHHMNQIIRFLTNVDNSNKGIQSNIPLEVISIDKNDIGYISYLESCDWILISSNESDKLQYKDKYYRPSPNFKF